MAKRESLAHLVGHDCPWCGGRGQVDRGLVDPKCSAQEARKRIPCPKCKEKYEKMLTGQVRL